MSVMKYVKRTLKQRIPIVEWISRYNSHKFISDTIAGVTVGLTVMPQALAYATLAGLEPQNVSQEIVLIDLNEKKAQGEVLDIHHGSMFLYNPQITASKDFGLTQNSKVCIVTAGVRRKDGQSRRDPEYTQSNADVLKGIIPTLVKHSPDAVIIIVSNPVDILTFAAWKLSGLPQHQVIGCGTSLETQRFRFLLSQKAGISPESCRGWIIGEHGDTCVALWSGVNFAGVRLRSLNPKAGKEDDPDKWLDIFKEVKESSYRIVSQKGYTNWAIALDLTSICRSVLSNSNTVHAVSVQAKYGLYSAFAGCFVYVVFGTCKDITIGPTALMALMTYQQIIGRNTDYAILLCFLSGVVQLLMGILHLGVLIDFISIPVTVGFTSATSVIIAASQLKSLLGLKISPSGFLDTVTQVFQNIHKTRFTDLGLGVTCIIVLMLLRKLKNLKLSKSTKTKYKHLNKMLWLFATSRNALVVIFCSTMAYFYETYWGGSPVLLTGTVRPGLPEMKPPPFQTVLNNRTISMTEMMGDLGSSIVLVPVIAVLGNVAIAKAFASGEIIDANQELFTLSLCNIFGSFFSSMPITGSFSRSAVNHASGVQTPMGGIFTGIMVILALSFLTPYFAYIPKASLGAVIISAVIFMIEYEVVKPMWRSSKKDLISTFATFVLCLIIGVEYGILVGVAINIVFLLYPSARPTVFVEKCETMTKLEYLVITPGNSLYFPAVDFIKTSVGKAGVSSKHLPVVIDCRFVLGADFTAAKGISALINEFSFRKQPLYFLHTREEVVSVFQGVVEEDFRYFQTKEELEKVLEENRICDETSKLIILDDVENSCTKSNVELREISSHNGSTLNHRTAADVR